MNAEYTRALQHRASMAVKRFHVMRTLRTQTVGEHSGAVATLVMQALPDCGANLLKAALAHDFHERSTGDMPSTAKALHPALAGAMHDAETEWNINRDNGVNEIFAALTPAEAHALCFCDYLELLLWAAEEIKLGNSYAWEAYHNVNSALSRMEAPSAIATEIHQGVNLRMRAFSHAHNLSSG